MENTSTVAMLQNANTVLNKRSRIRANALGDIESLLSFNLPHANLIDEIKYILSKCENQLKDETK